MANGILKGLAIAAGTGLAVGFGSGRARVRAFSHNGAPVERTPRVDQPVQHRADPIPASDPDDDFLNIEPLLDRLERVEARIELIEQRPPSSPAPSTPAPWSDRYAAVITDLERRIEENTRELTLLRERVADAERRIADSVTSVQRKVEQTREEIPAFVEQHVAARMDDLRARFAAEIEQSHQRTLETFERAIDEKISSRISSIERALTEQAGSIDALRERATETDNNLQRLVSAIEKLCERAQLVAPPPVERPLERNETRLPFESQLHAAMNREPVVPVFRTEEAAEVPVPAFAGGAAKKSRFLFRSLILILAGFSLHASRFVR
jgi:hypothetical protein